MNEKHADLPALLAEALDQVWAAGDGGGDVRSAAEQMGVSTSQLCKLLAKDPKALEWVNQLRRSKGMPPLRS